MERRGGFAALKYVFLVHFLLRDAIGNYLGLGGPQADIFTCGIHLLALVQQQATGWGV
jgi:hypothetical protein